MAKIVTITFTLSLLAASSARAQIPIFNELRGAVPGARFQHRCQTCHDNGARRNVFGRGYEKFFLTLPSDPDFSRIKEMTGVEKWKALLGLDSDGDGVSNIDEIMAGRNPGIAGR